MWNPPFAVARLALWMMVAVRALRAALRLGGRSKLTPTFIRWLKLPCSLLRLGPPVAVGLQFANPPMQRIPFLGRHPVQHQGRALNL
jgi:hypothetical protein